MTEILAMRVEMNFDGGQPRIYATVDKRPVDFVFLEYAKSDKMVRGSINDEWIQPADYVGWNNHGKGPWARAYKIDGNQEGCGGGEFTLKMTAGTKTIKGPWIGSGTIPLNTGVATVDMTLIELDGIEKPEVIWEIKKNWVEAIKGRGLVQHAAMEELRRKHYPALFHPSSSLHRGPEAREWDGSPEQLAFIAELVTWKGGLAFMGDLRLEETRAALERFCPGYTLYPYTWKPNSLGPDHPWWVAAPKSSTKIIGALDVPAPKREGFWGFAVHDEYGYPKTRFYETVWSLIEAEFLNNQALAGEVHEGRWNVSMRHEAGWHALRRDDQRLVDRLSRTYAAA